MLELKEFYSMIPAEQVTREQLLNLTDLCNRMNVIRKEWGSAMIVTSGLRTLFDQKRINPSRMKSNHLTGRACDVLDRDGRLKEWLLSRTDLLIECALWCEDFSVTPTWVHFQSVPPRSGNRFFLP